MSTDLKPCPFCGGKAQFERMGTPRQSCIVACSNCGARHESSDENERSGEQWNERAASPQPAAQPEPGVLTEARIEHLMAQTTSTMDLCRAIEREVLSTRKQEAVVDTCDSGHRFAKLADHPRKDGIARCPHCLSLGLDATRKRTAEQVARIMVAVDRYAGQCGLVEQGVIGTKMIECRAEVERLLGGEA